jgi:hypothetical protein
MKENKTIYLTDSPNVEQDSFQVHTNIAETLYGIIEKHNVSKNSFTIGLFGEWGSGKSFIVNKLSEKIKKDKEKDTTYLYIDIWKYSGFPLLRSILFDLDKQFCNLYDLDNKKYSAFSNGYRKNGQSLDFQLKYNKHLKEESKITPQESWEKILETLKKYKIVWVLLSLFLLFFLTPLFLPSTFKESEIYKSFSPFISALKSFISFTGIGAVILLLLKKPIQDVGNLVFFRSVVRDYTEQANFSPEQFEDIFKDMLGKIGNEKYVIIFDNLDRCEPNVAYETLSTIKTFMDIENCFYIIPADDDAIKNYLSNSTIMQNENNLFERKFSEEFIDKIFQTYVRIPVLKEVERDKYIKEQLTKIDFQDKLYEEDIETITQILYFAYKGESPRNIIRFINDYSTYFQLALNSLPKLLDNIMLFTIMIAIKQKWYHFERILLENPDYFNKYPRNKELLKQLEHNNTSELERFLDSIQSFYIPQIKNNSIDEYIHFKESEKSYEISDILKNNQPYEFELNDENVKILIREFKKIVLTKGQFSINSFMTFAKLISKNKKHRLCKNLVIEFWLGFIKTPNEQIKLILGKMLEEDILSKIMNSLNNNNLHAHKKDIEYIILSYFKEPFENGTKFEEYEKVFETIISSEYKFTPSLLKKLFSQWEKESLYLNSLLKIISKKEQTDYLPSNVLRQLVNAPIENTSLELLNNWSNKTISKPIGIKLFQVVLERIKQRTFVNNTQLARIKQNIEQDYGLILLLDISFSETSKIDDFINSISDLISRVFQFAANQQPLFELGVNLWVEITYFASVNNDLIDTQLLKIFNQYIKPNPTVLQLLNEKVKYSGDILSLSKTKQSIFISSPELQIKLYKELKKEDFSNFDLITSTPIENNHIAALLKHMKENSIDFNNTKFSGFILEKIIKELIDEKIDITEKLIYLRETFDLKDNKQLILDYKNGIIDYYKNKSPNAFNVFKEFNIHLSYSDFFNNILKPILSFIHSELGQGEDIKGYVQIAELIVATNKKKDIELLYSVAKQCLEKSQSIEENYFGISIIEKLFENISDENKDEISVLINDNDNYEHWEQEKINRLKRIGVISEKGDNVEES